MFALIDSLTLQSSFSGVRLESYMFTEESFRDVRDHLTDDGVLVIYNYFRERWLVDRLANTAAAAFGEEPVRPRPRGARLSRRPDGRPAAAHADGAAGRARAGRWPTASRTRRARRAC